MDEREALDAMTSAGAALVAGVRRALPGWAERRAGQLLDAWGGHPEDERARVAAEAGRAGEAAAARVAAALEALLALDPEEQRVTPLQLVRTAHREVTAVLRDAGVPPVVRDEFDERAEPGDLYGIVPRTFADLGDDELAPAHFTWGAAKAALHLVRRRGSAGRAPSPPS